MGLRQAHIGLGVMGALVLALALSGGGSDAATGSGYVGAEEPPVVDCDSRHQIIPPRHPRERLSRRVRRSSVIARPVVFLGAKQWADEPRRHFRPPDGEDLTLIKVPIYVHAGGRVLVAAMPPAGHQALISVGLDRAPYEVRASSVEFRPCRRKARVAGRKVGPWTPFTAGFLIDGPVCLRVSVDPKGSSEPMHRRIRFGRDVCRAD